MELCLITPAAHCQWTGLLPGRFCLANVKHDGYRELFAKATHDGYEVVLDNGVFENALVDNAEYIDVICEIKPRVVVAPDLMNANAQVNLQHAYDFANSVKITAYSRVDVPELMFVPQCERSDIDGYTDTITNAINSGLFHWLGICRNACFNAFGQFTGTENEAVNKFFFGAWAEQYGILKLAREKGVRFHLLGIGGNLWMLQYLWWVDRADTASLFFQATLGETVSRDGVLSEEVSRPPDYFRCDFGPSTGWLPMLKVNCTAALKYATAAARLRHKILKDRI